MVILIKSNLLIEIKRELKINIFFGKFIKKTNISIKLNRELKINILTDKFP